MAIPPPTSRGNQIKQRFLLKPLNFNTFTVFNWQCIHRKAKFSSITPQSFTECEQPEINPNGNS